MKSSTQLECRIARTESDLTQVYRLRYACYRRDASIPPNPDEQFSDAFDRLPNSFSFLVRPPDAAPLATVRISVVRDEEGWRDSPVQHVFGDHPSLHSMARQGFVEASRLCFAQQARRDAFVRLVGHLAAMSSFYETGWLVACPRVEHSESYQRMFGFKAIAPARKYLGVSFQTQLLAISRKDIEHHVRNEKTMMNAWSNALERLTASAPPGLLREAYC